MFRTRAENRRILLQRVAAHCGSDQDGREREFVAAR